MTYAPASVAAVAKAWHDGGGVPLGIVGDADHTYGYHLGRDRIFGPKGQGKADYSVKTTRDRQGLTDAAMGIDLGRVNDSLTELQAFSEWLLRECWAAAPDTLDIRELIYSPDAQVVLRWDRERGIGSAPRPGEADDGHRTHDHVSWYRDAETHDLAAVFRRYFAQEGDMAAPWPMTIKAEDWQTAGGVRRPWRARPVRADAPGGYIESGTVVRTIAELDEPDAPGGDTWRVTRLDDGPGPARTVYVLRADLTPMIPGGDPVTDAALGRFIDRAASWAALAINGAIDLTTRREIP